ncbi:hypothetical protein EON63_24770 [archaeon]|nr:MAG: hypothetical protein EON63_24770 [archaeon]
MRLTYIYTHCHTQILVSNYSYTYTSLIPIPYPNYTNSIDLARSFGYSGIIVASYARIHFLN